MPEGMVVKESLWLDQPTTVRAGEALDHPRLESYLRGQMPKLSGMLVIQQFPGGYSNLTYALQMGTQEFVLRRPPFGANIKSAHDMGREYRILSALVQVYPKVPKPLLYCEDTAVIGAPFYVMERVKGVILRYPLPEGFTLQPEVMHGTCLALIDTLVELHRVDYVAAGLGNLGHPEGYATRQISGWMQRYQNAQTDDIPAMQQVAEWLAAHIPARSDAALIHNDYRYDNMIYDPVDLTRVKAILDWEMSTLGDPLLDVGTSLAYWAEPGDPPEMQRYGLSLLPGNLNRQQFVDYYAERSGRDLSDVLFAYVYGLFKLAVIVQQIYRRYRLGFTQDARFASLIHAVHADSQMALRAIERNRIHNLMPKE